MASATCQNARVLSATVRDGEEGQPASPQNEATIQGVEAGVGTSVGYMSPPLHDRSQFRHEQALNFRLAWAKSIRVAPRLIVAHISPGL